MQVFAILALAALAAVSARPYYRDADLEGEDADNQAERCADVEAARQDREVLEKGFFPNGNNSSTVYPCCTEDFCKTCKYMTGYIQGNATLVDSAQPQVFQVTCNTTAPGSYTNYTFLKYTGATGTAAPTQVIWSGLMYSGQVTVHADGTKTTSVFTAQTINDPNSNPVNQAIPPTVNSSICVPNKCDPYKPLY